MKVGCLGCGRQRSVSHDPRFTQYCMACSNIREWFDVPPPGRWIEDARCAETDPELFFPDKWGHTQRQMAKAICNSCEVRLQCLQYALLIETPHGIWGGLTPEERHTIRREPA